MMHPLYSDAKTGGSPLVQDCYKRKRILRSIEENLILLEHGQQEKNELDGKKKSVTSLETEEN